MVELASEENREDAVRAFQDIQTYDRLLDNVFEMEVASDEYAGYEWAIQAIQHYLGNRGFPDTEDGIVRALAHRWRGGKSSSKANLLKSVRTNVKNGRIKKVGTKVGLIEWPEDKFAG
ncbi:MAG TPA: hypothetical protein VGD64_06525 [Acidisarcina sp.]